MSPVEFGREFGLRVGQRVTVSDAESPFVGIDGAVFNIALRVPGMSEWRIAAPVDVRLDRAPEGYSHDYTHAFPCAALCIQDDTPTLFTP